jgi:coenzyme F420-reducing hydrogenase alpha subunit
MAQDPNPLKLFQIEEPDGASEAADGLGMAVGIELSRHGASLAAAIGGNAEWLIAPEPGGIMAAPAEPALTELLRGLRAAAEKALARPVTHAVIRVDGIEIADIVLLRAAAAADIALLGIRRDGSALDAAIEAEDLVAILSN